MGLFAGVQAPPNHAAVSAAMAKTITHETMVTRAKSWRVNPGIADCS
jgi:hypothetical protein